MFCDRTDAGKQLAQRLHHLHGDDVVVVGLPRGGVPVAAEVADALDAPLDVVIVRKLGVPFQPELAMGAIGEGGIRVLNQDIIERTETNATELRTIEDRERDELERRAVLYRSDAPAIPLEGKVVIVVDDGIATGSTASAACQIVRARGAKRVVLAVPVAPADWKHRLAGVADEMINVKMPRHFSGVGEFYQDFSQTTDEEVLALLERANRLQLVDTASPAGVADEPQPRDDEVDLQIRQVRLSGHLTVPEHARGVVVFAHGSGSSRHSPRNRFVAEVLNEAGLATLLFDLLTPDEEQNRSKVFDVELLAGRLRDVTRILLTETDLGSLPVAYFGASTGAAAALRAAAAPESMVTAVVSRGGRPDLAGLHLHSVKAPTLLIVGGNDDVVLGLNEMAEAELRCESELRVVPGATHVFEEPGTLQAAAELARDWILGHQAPVPA
ncbi:MAG: alpha/beta family hydrolase [Acidimicrobiales bacterium]